MLVARRISPYHISESSGEKVKRKNTKPNFFCPIYEKSIILYHILKEEMTSEDLRTNL